MAQSKLDTFFSVKKNQRPILSKGRKDAVVFTLDKEPLEPFKEKSKKRKIENVLDVEAEIVNVSENDLPVLPLPQHKQNTSFSQFSKRRKCENDLKTDNAASVVTLTTGNAATVVSPTTDNAATVVTEQLQKTVSDCQLRTRKQTKSELFKQRSKAFLKDLKKTEPLEKSRPSTIDTIEEVKRSYSKNKHLAESTLKEAISEKNQSPVALALEEKRLPAYQRFQYLTEPGLPPLNFPFTYKTLEETFQSADQVVSMLHNRSEMCTFSKLKAAVQNITRKNFEIKTIGQIKTIVPDAYTFRQEKNILQPGGHRSDYHLTIEANLQAEDVPDESKLQQKTAEGKPVFSASMLLKRQSFFKKNLLNCLLEQHRKFMLSRYPDYNVPDIRLTRWHPEFRLDNVPEVVSSELPQPPEIKEYHSAKDVLEKQRGKLNPMVEKALTKVAESTIVSTPASASCKINTPPKGIPPALFAKIKAKESKRMEEALTRKPEEDRKTRIMNRLPEMIRILRNLFVLEKKPALSQEIVYKKLGENYKSGISLREVEEHINMLKELAPEFIYFVEVKNGKYVKIDKNIDISAMISKIQNLVKAKS